MASSLSTNGANTHTMQSTMADSNGAAGVQLTISGDVALQVNGSSERGTPGFQHVTIKIPNDSSASSKGRPPSSSASFIYGIPEKLYVETKEAYTPQAVFIGPLHSPEVLKRPMQLNKAHYVDCFFARTKTDKNSYTQEVKKLQWNNKARECYQVKITLKRDKLEEMLLEDGIFIVEFLLKVCFPDLVNENDEIFSKSSLKNDILHDIIMVQNQLPFFVISDVYEHLSQSGIPWPKFLHKVAKKYFERGVLLQKVKDTLEKRRIRQLADFLHALCMESIPSEPSNKPEPQQKAKLSCGDDPLSQQKFELSLSRSATELRAAGVKFEKADANLPYDLSFTPEGVLKFPPVIVNRWTKYFFRNYIAHEYCLHENRIISSYIILMSSLLKEPKDVDFLIGCGIIDNRSLRSSEGVCTLFKNLYRRSMMDKDEFHYTSVCEDLNNYRKDTWHQCKAACYEWKEMVKRDYFSQPWSLISGIAGFLLLSLTIILTVNSIISVRKGGTSA